MIVVADATPLHYLILIQHIDTLPKLYGRVVVPEAVVQELRHPSSPVPVQAWMARMPQWLEVQKSHSSKVDTALEALDPGEREAILLAVELHANLLLIDERAGRREATRRSLQVAGTLAVLEKAADHHLLDLPNALERPKSDQLPHLGRHLGIIPEPKSMRVNA